MNLDSPADFRLDLAKMPSLSLAPDFHHGLLGGRGTSPASLLPATDFHHGLLEAPVVRYLRHRLLLLSFLLCCHLLATGLSAETAGGYWVSFGLVPEDRWSEAESGSTGALLPSGTVFLYREGSYEPERTIPANVDVELPPGAWTWTAEAPGYVTYGSGTVVIPKGERAGPAAKWILWPVVPACELRLEPDRRWRSVRRLDLLSLDRATLTPINPATRTRVWIPAGRNLAYSVDGRGLGGIKPLVPCRANESRPLEPPTPPPADRQDVMAHLVLPTETNLGTEPPQIFLETIPQVESETVAPFATVRIGDRVSAIFLNVPADRDHALGVRHEMLRTVSVPFERLGGSARELPVIEARPRLALELAVDYRPARAHRDERLVVTRCAERFVPRRGAGNPCRHETEEIALDRGMHSYRVGGLDNGRYAIDAVVDDERVPGLGVGATLRVEPEDPEPAVFWSAIVLREMEIYGHLLLDGEPVAGEVRLRPAPSSRELARRFPTDDELLYHLFFFGRLPFGTPWPDGDPDDWEASRGLPSDGKQLDFCSAGGLCRSLNLHSSFIGEGRLDLELASEYTVALRAYELASGRPISGARVGIIENGRALSFEHGEVTWRTPPGSEGFFARTDANGEARIALMSPPVEPLAVMKTGFQTAFAPVTVKPGQTARVHVGLESERPPENTRRFTLAGTGETLEGAYLLVIRADGSRDVRCSALTRAGGVARLPDACLRESRIVVFHHQAALSVLDGRSILPVLDVSVVPAPERPVVLRVVDQAGRPLPEVLVSLRFGALEVTPNDHLLSLSRGGPLLFYATDGLGRLSLRGLDPDSAEAPVLALYGQYRGEAPLSWAAQGRLEIRAES